MGRSADKTVLEKRVDTEMIYDKINFFLPTYKRVLNRKLTRFIDSVLTYVSNLNSIMFTFLVNPDDKETIDYINREDFIAPISTLYWKQPTPHLGKMYNMIYEFTPWKDENILVTMVGDDQEFLTSHFDLRILDAINKINGRGFVYCNDTIQGKRLCTHLFTTRHFVWMTKAPFMCELFPAYFIDTVWHRIGQATGTAVYLDNVIIKHHHYTKNAQCIDETSQRLRVRQGSFKDGYAKVNQYIKPIIKRINTQ